DDRTRLGLVTPRVLLLEPGGMVRSGGERSGRVPDSGLVRRPREEHVAPRRGRHGGVLVHVFAVPVAVLCVPAVRLGVPELALGDLQQFLTYRIHVSPSAAYRVS